MYKMGGSCRDAKSLFSYPVLPFPYHKKLKNPAFLHLIIYKSKKKRRESFLISNIFCNFAAK